MNMPTTKKPAPNSVANTHSKADQAEVWSLDDHWPKLLSGLADQVTEGANALQNTIDQLLNRGSISKQEHRALSIPTDRIKLSGIGAQQIQRFYSGRIRQSHERICLAQLVEDVLQDRKKDLVILGIELRRKLKSVEVLVDPTVAHTFVNAVIEWGIPFGNRIDVRLDLHTWPQYARLQLRASNRGAPPSSSSSMDSLSWMLVRQVAQAAGGIEIERQTTDDGVNFTAMFTRTVQAVDGIAAVDFSDNQSSMFKTLAGVYVLTISPALQIRSAVRDALREVGISSDSVVDFAQAREAVLSRMPNLIVFDADVKDDGFEEFRRELLRDVFEFPFVEISPDDSSFDMSGFGELSIAKVGRGNIRESLGTAVMFELAKST
ncbi:hypothetical protein [Hydrogenophaga sp. BPS33]|uniref:hypothetical protein n=1 Tax=Hydrogenophaga sp. BPS33 TaxID=2651974 RepID=UPI00132020A4|nr:hypothetical protein [Hydrogenophaga sp. BPS33]QHE83800.1 hypothetical protein F9K07_02330 [Hydrogenophaga sp. BPS33]